MSVPVYHAQQQRSRARYQPVASTPRTRSQPAGAPSGYDPRDFNTAINDAVKAVNSVQANVPDPGLTPADLSFLGVPPGGAPRSPGGGSRRSGGGGGGGLSASARAAQIALYNSLKGNTGIDDAYGRYETSMKGVYDPSKYGQKWDTAKGDIGTASSAAQGRLSEIYDSMVARAAQGQEGVRNAIGAGDQRLRDVAARFGAQSAGATNQINDVLGAFDAGGLSNQGYANEINSQAMAAQLANARMGNAYEASFADRPEIYAALNKDIGAGMTAQEQALLSQIAGRRATEQSANEAQLAQILGQSGISRAQAAVSKETELAQLKAELAAMGIQV